MKHGSRKVACALAGAGLSAGLAAGIAALGLALVSGACAAPECGLVECAGNTLRRCVEGEDGFELKLEDCAARGMECSAEAGACVAKGGSGGSEAASTSASTGDTVTSASASSGAPLECGELTACGADCVNTAQDPANCGGCAMACGPGELCVASACVPPADCKILHLLAPNAPSGTYEIDPSGGDPSDAFMAECDATTDGGGWTLVFSQQDEQKFSTETLPDYGWAHPPTATFIAKASEVMAYFADKANSSPAAGFDKYKFPKPASFETLWQNPNVADVYKFDTATNLSKGGIVENVAGSRYSTSSFSTFLADADTTNWWGRFGVNSPTSTGFFFTAFTAVKGAAGETGKPLFCNYDHEAWNTTPCGSTRYLVIWVR